jgi:hypothetical protein
MSLKGGQFVAMRAKRGDDWSIDTEWPGPTMIYAARSAASLARRKSCVLLDRFEPASAILMGTLITCPHAMR